MSDQVNYSMGAVGCVVTVGIAYVLKTFTFNFGSYHTPRHPFVFALGVSE